MIYLAYVIRDQQFKIAVRRCTSYLRIWMQLSSCIPLLFFSFFSFSLALLFSRRRDAPPSTKSNRDEEKNAFLPLFLSSRIFANVSRTFCQKSKTRCTIKKNTSSLRLRIFSTIAFLLFFSLSLFFFFPPLLLIVRRYIHIFQSNRFGRGLKKWRRIETTAIEKIVETRKR